MPDAAVPSLKTRATAANLSPDQRKLAVDSIAFIKSKTSAEALLDLAAKGSAVRDQALWWLINRSEDEWASFYLKSELEKCGLIEKPVALVEITVPERPESIHSPSPTARTWTARRCPRPTSSACSPRTWWMSSSG